MNADSVRSNLTARDIVPVAGLAFAQFFVAGLAFTGMMILASLFQSDPLRAEHTRGVSAAPLIVGTVVGLVRAVVVCVAIRRRVRGARGPSP